MTNGEKYKTAQERAEAFNSFCINKTMSCVGCEFSDMHGENFNQCRFAWLNLEADEENLLPCPFCGKKFVSVIHGEGTREGQYAVECYKDGCYYRGPWKITESEAIAANNRVAKAVMESEVNE